MQTKVHCTENIKKKVKTKLFKKCGLRFKKKKSELCLSCTLKQMFVKANKNGLSYLTKKKTLLF